MYYGVKAHVKWLEEIEAALEYLIGTVKDHTQGMIDTSQIKSYIDLSYVLHANMKSHTGGAVS